MNPEFFRKPLIEALRAAQAQRSESRLHLLYCPELADPLTLIGDTRRETAWVRPPSAATHAGAPQKENIPRLITLDCLRVAKYLMETDASLNDPLFEASITLAHAEIALRRHPDAELENDEREAPDFTIGGWLVSGEPASAVAARIQSFPHLKSAQQRREWVRWTNPAHLSALWPTLKAEQRQALLDRPPPNWLEQAPYLRERCPNVPPAARWEQCLRWSSCAWAAQPPLPIWAHRLPGSVSCWPSAASAGRSIHSPWKTT